jgi:D-alanyl-D-alanine carboxypeptidase
MSGSRRRFLSLIPFLAVVLSAMVGAPGAAFAQTPPDKPSEPQISAESAIVIEYPSGRILYQKDAHHRMPPASLTKIMTAILALEYGNLNDVISIVPEDLAGESTMGLAAGEQQTLHDLMYGMLLPSGNDAAMAIARYLGSRVGTGTPTNQDPVARFADMMNMRVSQLGLTDTHFITPHGLDTPGHYSTAYDLASLAWYALHIPTFNDIVKTVSYDAPGHSLLNTNEMLTRYDGADGIKTGWTDGCGLCLVTSATRGGHRLVSVVLNAPQWYSDSSALLDYGFAALAATPSDPSAETLSIAKRDAVAWLLANPASAPPVAQTPKPQPASNAALAQGGGSSAQPASPKLAAPPQLAQAAAPAAQLVPAGAVSSSPAVAAGAVGASHQGAPMPLLVLAIVALVLSMCCVFAARLLHFRPAALASGATSLAVFARGDRPSTQDSRDAQSSPGAARTWVDASAGRASGVARTTAIVSGRREPNLLFESHQDATLHIERAIAHSAEGRQGSGMSEFVLALKSGAEIDVAELAEQYRLTAAAFLALSRAQVATGNREDARRTLLHGVLVLPADRMLRLALYQLPPQS